MTDKPDDVHSCYEGHDCVKPAPEQRPKPTTLDHPCRQTCSGWQQGYERGKSAYDALKADYEGLVRDYEKQYADYTNLLNSATVKAFEGGYNGAQADLEQLRAQLEHFKNAVDLLLYYVEGDATYEGVKMKVEKMLRGEK